MSERQCIDTKNTSSDVKTIMTDAMSPVLTELSLLSSDVETEIDKWWHGDSANDMIGNFKRFEKTSIVKVNNLLTRYEKVVKEIAKTKSQEDKSQSFNDKINELNEQRNNLDPDDPNYQSDLNRIDAEIEEQITLRDQQGMADMIESHKQKIAELEQQKLELEEKIRLNPNDPNYAYYASELDRINYEIEVYTGLKEKLESGTLDDYYDQKVNKLEWQLKILDANSPTYESDVARINAEIEEYKDLRLGSAYKGLISEAEQHMGTRYVWGGTSPTSGFDCSGFVQYVYRQAGYGELPRQSAAMYNATTRVSAEDVKPGDLVFFNDNGKGGVSHVGIYTGDGQMIHTGGNPAGVTYADLNSAYNKRSFMGYGRLA